LKTIGNLNLAHHLSTLLATFGDLAARLEMAKLLSNEIRPPEIAPVF
jgi:hypothetical protein